MNKKIVSLFDIEASDENDLRHKLNLFIYGDMKKNINLEEMAIDLGWSKEQTNSAEEWIIDAIVKIKYHNNE